MNCAAVMYVLNFGLNDFCHRVGKYVCTNVHFLLNPFSSMELFNIFFNQPSYGLLTCHLKLLRNWNILSYEKPYAESNIANKKILALSGVYCPSK